MLTIHNTESWDHERVMAYGPQITGAMHKLQARFPHDVSIPDLFQAILSGARQLWLILDGDVFGSFVLTEVRDNPETNHMMVIATDLAGEGGLDVVPLVSGIEEWARKIGADEVRLVGRVGWRKALSKEGYHAGVMTYTKALEPLAEAA